MSSTPQISKHHKGACHCGSVQFEMTPVDGANTALRCNCSICRMRGATMVMAKTTDLAITKGQDKLSLYQFGSKAAKHYFCSVCGIPTFHQRRFDPTQYAVNVACLEGISPYDFAEVPVVDGTNHPKDQPGGGGSSLRKIGVFTFVKS